MRRFWTLAILACIAFWSLVIGGVCMAVAHADTTVVNPDGTPSVYQAVVDRALVPTPDITVIVYTDPCPGAESMRSCTWQSDHVIFVPGYDPGAFLHELGHQAWYLTPKLQRDWPKRDRANSPHEKFAEAYRVCAEFGAFDDPPLAALQEGFGYGYWPYHEAATCLRISRVMRKAGVATPMPSRLRTAQ
jgi:hypothetical protein